MKKSIISIITLTLCIINLVLNVLIIFSVVPTVTKTDNLIGKIAAIVDLEISGVTPNSVGTLAIDEIEPISIVDSTGSSKITVTLSSADGKAHYAIVNVTVSLDKTHEDYSKLRASVDNAMNLMINCVDTVVSSYPYETALDNKAVMEDEILTSLKNLFQSDFIYDVSFNGFIVQ